jgi:hypothetical protein
VTRTRCARAPRDPRRRRLHRARVRGPRQGTARDQRPRRSRPPHVDRCRHAPDERAGPGEERPDPPGPRARESSPCPRPRRG